ncbi:MAG TPA: crotonase/enoyl-CoA hydratase family protein [Rectinemataceae bacterium]|nr:crotonase/enoyl-CoA hydratase family protein [Rectinemataceae bacterium]
MGNRPDRLRIDIEGSTAIVTLTRADKHNGVDLPMLEAVKASQKRLRGMRDLRGVILRGEGPSFCSGLDFKSVLGSPLSAIGSYLQLWKPFRNDFQTWSLGWRKVPVPVVALLHGSCFGAGLQLGLGADIRVAAPDARLSLMEAKWGLVPDMGGISLLRELLSIDVAKELTMSGRVVSAEEALALGLVTHLSTEPLEFARGLLAEFATRSPDSVAAGKFLLQEAWLAPTDEALGAERRWQRRLLGRGNQRIAMAGNSGGSEKPFGPRTIG